MKIKYRREPKPGVVFSVDLHNGTHAYFCSIDGLSCWLYGFLTDCRTRKREYFATSRWRRPYLVWNLTPDFVDVCKIDLTTREETRPARWRLVDQADVDSGRYPTRYEISAPGIDDYYGTETDVRYIFKEEILMHDTVRACVLAQESEMELIHVPPEDRDTRLNAPATDAPKNWAEDECRIVEIIFPGSDPVLVAQRDKIEEQFELELEGIEAGSVNGSGALTDAEGNCGSFDITLDIEPRRMKAAMRAIRSVLKRFKAPPETEILEHHPEYEEPIKHPLVGPAKKRMP